MSGSGTHVTEPVVHVASFGRHLIGRDIGLEIRRRYFSGPSESWPTQLDFTGVEQATESCIDELLGTLARDCGLDSVTAVRINGASRGVTATIQYVLSLVSCPPLSISVENVKQVLATSRRSAKPARRPRTHRKK